MNGSTIVLTITEPGSEPRQVQLSRPIVTVGKLSTSTLRLDDPTVSRKHCVLEHRADGGWRVTDLGSTAGTLIGEERIVQRTLEDGDRLVLGQTSLVVHLAARGADAVPPPLPEAPDVPSKTEAAPPLVGAEEDVGGSGPAVLEVALIWGSTLMSVEQFKGRGRPVTIGEARGVDFTVPANALGRTHFELVRPAGDGWELNVTAPAIRGDLLLDGEAVSLDELRAAGVGALPLRIGTRARLRCGDLTLLVRWTRAAVRPRAGATGGFDARPAAFVCLSLIAHFAFLGALAMIPDEVRKKRIDPAARRARMVEVFKTTRTVEVEPPKLADAEPEPPETEPSDQLTLDDTRTVADTQPQPERPDVMRNKLARRTTRTRDALSSGDVPTDPKKRRELATTVGAVKVLEQTTWLDDPVAKPGTGVAFKTLTSTGELDERGLQTTIFGDAPGNTPPGGFQPTSSGEPAPGGPAVASLKRPDDDGKKPRNIDMDAPRSTFKPLPPNVSPGGLSRADVLSHIRRNVGAIRWCYRDALQRTGNLAGKVTLSFKILPSGAVATVATRASGAADDASMLACMRRKVGRWRFPTVPGGGVTKVSYPVILKRGGKR